MIKQLIHIFLLILVALIALILSFLIFSFSFDLVKPYSGRPVMLISFAFLLAALFLAVYKLSKGKFRYFLVCTFLFYLVFNTYELYLRKQAFLSSKDILGLQLLNDFYADEDGIYLADPKQRKNVNQQGFLSRDFYNPGCKSGAPRVLFLGDSFTWGAEADLGKSFVALTDSAGYCTFNTGIPSTDPAQYLAVAQKYIPVIQPDIVLLMFCMDNDIMWCERPVLPHVPITYAADGVINGLLIDGYKPNSCPLEPFASFEEAKLLLSQHFHLYETSFWGNTATGTLFTAMLKQYPITGHFFDQPEFPMPEEWPAESVTDKYLKQIQQLCEEENIPFWIFIIPGKQQEIRLDLDYYRNDVEMLFDQYQPENLFCPQNIILADYEPDPNAHLNNDGHRKFSEAIITQLDAYFKPNSTVIP